MADKGKKSPYVSKGLYPTVTKSLKKAVRGNRSDFEVSQAKLDAWFEGKKVWLTVPNPAAKEGSNKPFIRVLAKHYWGEPPKDRNFAFTMTQAQETV